MAQDVAIIVSPQNTTDELSFKDLVKIFKREKQYWKDGTKIYLLTRETGSAERQLILKKVYQMSDEELKVFWRVKVFRGEMASLPMTLSSNEAVKRFVSRSPNAIGFIDASLIDPSVKVVRIDEKVPGDPGYPLSVNGRPTR